MVDSYLCRITLRFFYEWDLCTFHTRARNSFLSQCNDLYYRDLQSVKFSSEFEIELI